MGYRFQFVSQFTPHFFGLGGEPTFLLKHHPTLLPCSKHFAYNILTLKVGSRVRRIMSESKAVAPVPRPAQMRRLQTSKLPMHMFAALAFATFNTGCYYYFVFRERREAYRRFYATYDADKAYEEMKKTGIFQSTAIIEGAADEEE